MRSMTVHSDLKLMRKKWPGFCVLKWTSRLAHWRGRLQPISQVYLIDIYYRLKRHTGRATFSLPQVTVVQPLLHRRDEQPDEPIPHHYPNHEDPQLPFLCLYDPEAGEWDPRRPIATTIIPWAIDWLACYEGWLATGQWTGGGRAHDV